MRIIFAIFYLAVGFRIIYLYGERCSIVDNYYRNPFKMIVLYPIALFVQAGYEITMYIV
jgi:hypothetical protein